MSKPPPDQVRAVCRVLGWLLLLTLLVAQVWGLYLLVPGSGEPVVPGQDKVAHALLFGTPFALALLLGARSVSLGILLHAVVSEPLQGLLTSTRTADPWDTIADLVGIGLASVLVVLVRRQGEAAAVAEPDAVRIAP